VDKDDHFDSHGAAAVWLGANTVTSAHLAPPRSSDLAAGSSFLVADSHQPRGLACCDMPCWR